MLWKYFVSGQAEDIPMKSPARVSKTQKCWNVRWVAFDRRLCAILQVVDLQKAKKLSVEQTLEVELLDVPVVARCKNLLDGERKDEYPRTRRLVCGTPLVTSAVPMAARGNEVRTFEAMRETWRRLRTFD